MAERIMDGGDIILDVLNSHAVEYIFGSPGSEWPPFWEAMSRRLAEGEHAPTYINCRHEALAVGAAAGYYRSTGKLPAVFLHTTVGSLNCATALRGALHDGTPMLVCSGESIGYGEMAGIDPGAQWLHELSDIGGPERLLAPVVKWSSTVRVVETLADTIHRGCLIATASPRGPVFVNAPLEIMLEKVVVDKLPLPPKRESAATPDETTMREIAWRLSAATNPVVFAEHAGKEPTAVDSLIEIAESLALPIVETSSPETVNFPTDHHLHQGYDPRPWLDEADVLLLLDTATPWHPPSKGPREGATVIEFSRDPERRLKPYSGYTSDILVRGDLGASLRSLADAVRALEPHSLEADLRYGERMDKLTIAHQERRKALTEAALKKKNAVPVDPQWACHALNEAIPDDAMIVYELITHRVLVDRYLERRHAGESMRSFGGLGQGIPNALGVKTANPDRLVVSILGDGAFNYNPVLACFGLSQEYKMPILTVILNNGAYQSQQNTLERMYPGGFGKEHGKSIATGISPQPDYPKLIEAFGGWGRTVDEPDEIVPAVHEALEEVRNGRAALLNIMLAE